MRAKKKTIQQSSDRLPMKRMRNELNETSLPVLHIPEPPLEFSYGQKCAYPKDGLFLYGPHLKPQKTPQISIGHPLAALRASGISKTGRPSSRPDRGSSPEARAKRKTAFIFRIFQASRKRSAISFDPKQIVSYTIDPKELDEATRTINLHEAVSKAVDVYIAKVKQHDKTRSAKSMFGF